ncbi:replication initiation protein [Nocardioidaceae bacterium SCSIO 66511]|nr:replication initiation protein [Nocardioidaceae bacterium SCSIO 66511]
MTDMNGAQLLEMAELAGVCVRPVIRKRIDLDTGEEHYVPIPCGSTRANVCGPCAEKARQLRITQCREGWHRDVEPDGFDVEPGPDPEQDGDQADKPEEVEEASARRRRSTRRRDDAGDLPKSPTADTTLGRTFTSPDGKSYRPSMFLTFTLPSYGPVHTASRRGGRVVRCRCGGRHSESEGIAGTPIDPKYGYDYRKAALDALHFPKLVDRLFQNLRRAADYKVQYFATVEPQHRLALHLHAAVRGTIPRKTVRQVVDGTYHQVWWPQHTEPVYTGGRLPVWDDYQGGYVDPDSRVLLPSWDQAIDAIDPENDEPAYVIRAGKQFDYQGLIATNEREVANSVRYLTKYLTKSIAETYDPDTLSKPQREHRDRLHREVRWLPCSPKCANWLRFGVQPKDAAEGMRPGECGKKAHELNNLGHGGRRVLVSRQWSGKRLDEHKADRAAVVREVLDEAGIEMPDTDRYAADAVNDDGDPRYRWESLNLDLADGDADNVPIFRELVRQAITERNRWRTQYERAREVIASRDRPPENCSATQSTAVSDAA